MNGFMKVLTGLLGIMAIAACIATVGIIGYSFVSGGSNAVPNRQNSNNNLTEEVVYLEPTPLEEAELSQDASPTPGTFMENHVHDYVPTLVKKATCYEAGQIKYQCSCGDYYVVDQLSTGHVPDDWEIETAATSTTDGLRVKRCIYCDEIIARETIPATGNGENGSSAATPKHEHLYVATVEREATCTLAGLRKHTCSCGNFYTDSIPAVGHVASDWDEAEKPTTTSFGSSQRLCTVCGALLDVKVLLPLPPSPSPSPSGSPSASPSGSPSASASASGKASTSPSSSPTPTPTPHVHNYTNYVVTRATCTEKGVRSYICNCGSSYAESIELDLNNHKFEATFVAPTETQQGYTVYTCVRCNYSYQDNYIMPLTSQGQSQTSTD